MDKLKKVFSPGSKKDDEVLYGDAAERRRESASKAQEQQEPERLRPVEGSQKKEHSIMRQLVNPGGEKLDDQRFGSTATTQSGDPHKLETHPEAARKDHTIIGQILNPGHDKYDPAQFESTASTEGDRRQSVRPEAPAIAGPDIKLETDPQEKAHQHSILRQIINPGGAKYDEEGYGTTAHAAGNLGNAPSDTKDHSVARQILNPGQEKYDPAVHGGSGESGPSATGAYSSGLQQSTQPTAGAAPPVTQTRYTDPTTGISAPLAGASNTSSSREGPMPGSEGTNFGRDAAIVGGGAAATGAGAAAFSDDKPKHIPSTTTTTTTTTSHHPQPLTDRSVAGGSHINLIGAPEPTAAQAGESHLGRDAAIAGGAGLAGGAAVSQLNRPRDDIAGATYTERSQPLAGSSQTYGSGLDRGMGTGPTVIGSNSTGSSVGDAHVNPIGAPEQSLEGQSRLGQDSALAGGIGAAGVAADAGVTQLNKAPADVQQATYTERAYAIGGATSNDGVVHRTQGPHQTETANKLDPHVPGEFPGETGEDRHGMNPTTLGGATADSGLGATSDRAKKQTFGSRISAGVAGVASAVGFNKNASGQTTEPGAAEPITTSQDYASPEATGAEQPSEHHYGRDAAVVGGLGAAGAGTYAATRDHDDTQRIPELTAVGTQGYQPTALREQVSEPSAGRDAALAGGAGAAGIGAYEASKDTGPASKTIGPHDSNIANIVDPRVQPEPEKMKDSSTAGPYSSNLANKADPRVEADPAKNQETHYGRDAAVVGGAGAAGAGGYAAMEHDTPTAQQSTAPMQTDTTDPAVIAARRAAEKKAYPSRDAAPATAGAAAVYGDDKHDKKLQKAREEEYAHGGDKGGENKRSLIDKIFHPGHKSQDKESSARTSLDTDGHNKLHKKALGDTHHTADTSGQVIEPHTGLPRNPTKYGTDGAGGTDGARQIGGYHETDPTLRQASMGTAEGAGTKHAQHHAGEEGVAGPDWDAIKKANTPY